jgi:CRISPR type III-A/MTUBE-associated protein Csm6
MTVLFSPIGSTDPVSNYKDGGMIHICRLYKPDKVYLYLSKEMCIYHDRDDRYCESLRLLGKDLDHEFEIELIRDEEMENVQLFDAFIGKFEKIIDDIRRQDNPEKIIVNISSGTPAMKASLQMISILGRDIMAVQVATPLKSSNWKHEDKETYDYQLQWEFNEDRQSDFENRSIESNAKNLLDRIRKENICKYIMAYDYEAAKVQADELFVPPTQDFTDYLNIAIARKSLNLKYVNANRKKHDLSAWFPIVEERAMKEFEYLLSMQTKLQKKQYVDFMRDITPVFFSFSQRVLKKYCNLEFKDIGEERKECWFLSVDKIKEKGINPQYTWSNYTNIASSNILVIVEQLCEKKEVITIMQNIRTVESKVRNLAAHQILGISAEWIEKQTGFTPEKVMDMFFELANYSGVRIEKEYRRAYDVMNEDLIKKL